MCKKRAYVSNVRQRQADETRNRIVAAARRLLEERGYVKTTMEAIAQEAGVAVPTVYSIFRSKTGILLEILDSSRFGERYQKALAQALAATDILDQLKGVASISCSIFQSEDEILHLCRSAVAVSPELKEQEEQVEQHRYEVQKDLIESLARAGKLRNGLTVDRARDILWSLTSRDLYRLFVGKRGWSVGEYVKWLGESLGEMLLIPR